jgi:hypothetical protein
LSYPINSDKYFSIKAPDGPGGLFLISVILTRETSFLEPLIEKDQRGLYSSIEGSSISILYGSAVVEQLLTIKAVAVAPPPATTRHDAPISHQSFFVSSFYQSCLTLMLC